MSRDVEIHNVLSDYREFPAPPQLAAHFLCFWTQSIVGLLGDYGHCVLPDGCIDIVFINDDPPVVVGPWTDPFVVRLAAGAKIVGARLHPGRAPSLLGVPASELRNCSVPLTALWGTKSERFASISDEPDLPDRMSVLAEALLGSLAVAAPFDEVAVASIGWLARHPHGRVEQLSQWVGISSRHLQRRFLAAVGYGPKMFQSILRFQRLLNLAGATRTHQRLAELAADAGYADQAHMTREVQRFANCPPTALLCSDKCTLRMSDLFKTCDRLWTSLGPMTRRKLLASLAAEAGFIMRRGDAMAQIGDIKVLFIAGFGPIVREVAASRNLYSQILGISFKEENGGYLHTEALEGANSFALWPLSQAAQSCFGKDSWPDEISRPQAWLEFDVDSVEKATAELESQGYQMLVKSKKEPWEQTVSRFIGPEGLLVGITFTSLMREEK